MSKHLLQGKLTLFDVTNLVVGAIIGADIYVASSFGASYLGPLSLIVWVVSGIIAIVIALCFAQCAAHLPRVGGPYAYVREAWGPFVGFTVGWSLWLAEWISLAVFPVAFTRYLMFFFPALHWTYQTSIKVVFVFFLALTNIVGVRAAGRVNDVLTIVKLTPLVFFTGVGLFYMILNPASLAANLSPFMPYGFSNFGRVLVLIFWAYAGFELSTIPAEEIKDPGRTIPRAIVLGISIVTIFYLATNFVLFGVRTWTQLASDTAPLASATYAVLHSNPTYALLGGLIVGGGALISVAGSDESAMLGTSRLGYALAFDGLFPHAFAKIHPKFKTPYVGIVVQAGTALVASILGTLDMLIATSVLFMAMAYLATSASLFKLRKKFPEPRFQLGGGPMIPIMGVIFSIYLISQCSTEQFAVGFTLLIFGVIIYLKYSPGKELTELKEAFLSREAQWERMYAQEDRFLAHFLRHGKRLYRKITGKKQAWVTGK